MVVSGAVSGGTGVSISSPGAITRTSGNIVAGTGTVSLFGGAGINFAGGISGPTVLLQALGDVIETGGVLNAGTLTVVTETGAAVLDSAGNAVARWLPSSPAAAASTLPLRAAHIAGA